MKPAGTIAFSSGISVDFDIWALTLSSGELKRLTSGDNLNDQPCFSPDGNRIVYVSTQEDSIPSLWLMDRDGGNKQRLTSKYFCQTPTFSADGKKIIFSANAKDANNIDIVQISIDSPMQQPEVLVDSAASEWGGSLSPCGSKLVYCESGVGFDTEIKEIHIPTKKVRTLASHPARDICPKFSPDGKTIAFISYREGFDEKRYAEISSQISLAVSTSDMRKVNTLIQALHSLEGDSEIFLMDSEGANLKQLTHNKGSDANICWSPCGNFICRSTSAEGQNASERLTLVDVRSGKDASLDFDRSALESEIGAAQRLNATWMQKLLPDLIERRLIPKYFWGEERSPAWTASS